MRETDHKYTPANVVSRTLPAAVEHYLDGANLLQKMQALRLSTIDAEGWPHAALLSAGDMVAMPGGNIRFALFPQSGTVANLARDGRLTVTLSLDGVDYTISVYCIMGGYSAFWECPKCTDQNIAPVPAAGSAAAIKLCTSLINRHHAHYHSGYKQNSTTF